MKMQAKDLIIKNTKNSLYNNMFSMMKSNLKIPVFENKPNSLSVKPRVKLEFIDLIIRASKSIPNLQLNIPETLIKHHDLKKSCMIFTTEEGNLYIKENIKPI